MAGRHSCREVTGRLPRPRPVGHRLVGPPGTPSSVWTPATTPLGVLHAMAVEGQLVEVLPRVWVAADLVGDPAARAAALVARLADEGALRPAAPGARPHLPAGAVVGLAAAAWVHGCPVPPRRVDLLVPLRTGPRGSTARCRLRRVPAPRAGSCERGGVAVSGPTRTLADLRASADAEDLAVLAWAEEHLTPSSTCQPGAS
ncbi:type IV toxin-antitoxin system AbiEi family antitoxin [Pseudokineococcus sp. 1T1Z-3]|uniref:type IV toxin-antitoxin system AbiEi family antitoxin n=1 Tax=Pseudokineococcus sp. 1T1Z-3 TaxID=3132745 RepID=UPI0030B5C966